MTPAFRAELTARLTRFGLTTSNIATVVADIDATGLNIVEWHDIESDQYVSLKEDGTYAAAVYVHKGFANWKSVSPPGSVLLDDGSGWRKHFPEFQERRSPNDHVEQKPLGNCPVHFGPLNPDGTCPLCEDAA